MIQMLLSIAYAFAIVSYLASAGSEALASLFRWRSATLLRGVEAILKDETTRLARDVYNNPLINPTGQGKNKAALGKLAFKPNLPSYIDPGSFAFALMQCLKMTNPAQFKGKSSDEVQRFIAEIPALKNELALQNLLSATIIRNDGDFLRIQQSIAVWFENGTARVTGSYKRRIQFSNFCIGLILAALFNISPLPSTATLAIHADQATVAALVGAAPAVTPSAPTSAAQGLANVPSSALAPPKPGASATNASTSTAPVKALTTVFGWLLTALSTLLGAPFWFELIGKIKPGDNPAKGAGPRPSALPGPVAAAPPPTPAAVNTPTNDPRGETPGSDTRFGGPEGA